MLHAPCMDQLPRGSQRGLTCAAFRQWFRHRIGMANSTKQVSKLKVETNAMGAERERFKVKVRMMAKGAEGTVMGSLWPSVLESQQGSARNLYLAWTFPQYRLCRRIGVPFPRRLDGEERREESKEEQGRGLI